MKLMQVFLLLSLLQGSSLFGQISISIEESHFSIQDDIISGHILVENSSDDPIDFKYRFVVSDEMDPYLSFSHCVFNGCYPQKDICDYEIDETVPPGGGRTSFSVGNDLPDELREQDFTITVEFLTAPDCETLLASTDFELSNQASSIDFISSDDFKIFPNPVSSDLYLEFPKSIKSIAIFNQLGHFIKALPNSFSRTNQSIDMSAFESGIYTLKFELNGHKTINKRVIKI